MDSHNLKVCRICQEDETESEQVLHKPCKCNSHVHKDCLLQWIKTKIKSDIIDYQNDLQCEVCLSKIRYTHKTTLDNPNERFSNIKLVKDMTNFFFKRNMNFFKIILGVIFLLFVPILLFAILYGILEGFLSQKRLNLLNTESVSIFNDDSASKLESIVSTIYSWINLDYFPTEGSVFINGVVNEFLFYMTSIPLITTEFSQETTQNVFYKMYEYFNGPERATKELQVIRNQINELENISKLKFVLYYVLTIIIGIPSIFVFLVLREVIPRYIIGCKYNLMGSFDELYYGSYFTLTLCCVLYFLIMLKQYNNIPISLKTFVCQQFLKLVIDSKIQEMSTHALGTLAVSVFEIERYITFSNKRNTMMLQFNPSFEFVSCIINSLTYLRTHIFRNGVLYKFPYLALADSSQKKIKAMFFFSIPRIIWSNVLGLIYVVVGFFGIGGAGIIAASYLKPEIFPLILATDRVERMVLKTLFFAILPKQLDVLKEAVYIPVFQKLGSLFRLSNYLFDYDRPFERGQIVYHPSVGDSPVERKEARDSNPLLFKEPCVSVREAVSRLEKGNQQIKAYLVQSGYNAKIPNASSIFAFSNDWFKPLNHAGHVIIKAEPIDENTIPEDVEESDTGSLLDYAFPDYESYDMCFLPSNFTLRLYSYFFIISLLQNLLVFIGIVAGYNLGDKLYQIKEVQQWITFFTSRLAKDDIVVAFDMKYAPTVNDAFTKIIIGTSALCAMIKVVSTNMKNSSFISTDKFKNLKRKVSSSVLSSVIIAYGMFMGMVVMLSVTYFLKTVSLLWTSIVYNYASISGQDSFLFFIHGMFFQPYYLTLNLPLFGACLLYSFFIRFSINNELQANNRSTFEIWRIFFQDFVCSHFKIWAHFFGKPWMYQMIVFFAYCTIHSIKYDEKLSLFKARSFSDFNTYLFLMQLQLLLGGRIAMSIFYKVIFAGHVIFNIANWIYPILEDKWENWKLITLDNKLGEKDVIILNDE
ncbi:uncharacterized protein HGUI_01466 [Hanseniaspora guilliermondii]|uniref:RING-type E3 ubiquitin transferase n=1 Tax=Hanseniaspora guilliermondii TaxID=56406 RepID=A0A1L0AYQ8_9ASCO|nr:uncharacterized protein HGUI_01466 [Hanseniaspora guilliermondii]